MPKDMISLRTSSIGRRLALCLVSALFLPALALAQSEAELRTGIYRGRPVTYTVLGDWALYEGDILLGRVGELELPGKEAPAGIGIAYPTGLWPRLDGVYQVPYVISGPPGVISEALTRFQAALGELIRFVPRAGETDYVDFNLNPADPSRACLSFVGRIGGRQEIFGSIDCAVETLLHEMGHAIGLWHEQSRSDRDTFVTVLFGNIIKSLKSNFDQLLHNEQSLGLYDYRSIMHYFPSAFSVNGEPTIESIPAGIPLSNTTGYTESDLDSIRRLYNAAPTPVTVTSNPPGLQVMVDGVTITTPQTFDYELGSKHTLDVPAGSQTLGPTTHIYGRWNDDPAGAHTITIAPGNGSRIAPATSPAVTVYVANFIELVPYTQAVFPAGAGTVNTTPAAQSYPPAAGVFYVAREPVTLEAIPEPGQNFYGWFGIPFPFSANPRVFRTPGNPTAGFTSSPVTTIATNPPGRWIWVDGAFQIGPRSFALPYDAGWAEGTVHNVNVLISPQLPFSINTRYPFTGWSDGGAQSHDITATAESSTLTANFNTQHAPVFYVNQSCAGSLTVTPSSPDRYYDLGTVLSYQVATNPGWELAEWREDLTGRDNPQMLAVSGEQLLIADFNTVPAPIKITSLDPPSAQAGGKALTLTINGTGFTASTRTFVNGFFRPPTFVSPEQMQLGILAGDIESVGAFPVAVSNFPEGAPCAAVAFKSFFVVSGS